MWTRRAGAPTAPVTTLLAVALAGTLGGCALATGTPPSVDVMDVRLVGVGLTEQQLATTLCVTNPNDSALAFRRVAVTLDVSGAPLATGSSDLPLQLPPHSSTAVPFTVVTTVQNLGPQLLGILRSGSLDYRIHGTVSLQGAFGLTLPFSRAGQLDPLAGGLNLASVAASGEAPSRCASPAPPPPHI